MGTRSFAITRRVWHWRENKDQPHPWGGKCSNGPPLGEGKNDIARLQTSHRQRINAPDMIQPGFFGPAGRILSVFPERPPFARTTPLPLPPPGSKSVIALLKDPTADSPRQNDRILHVLYVFLVAQPLYNPNTSFTLSYTSFYNTLTFEMR